MQTKNLVFIERKKWKKDTYITEDIIFHSSSQMVVRLGLETTILYLKL